jgi:hypothetical protein
MLSYIRAVVVAACLVLLPAGFAGTARADESPSAPAPLLLGQYSGRSQSSYSSRPVRIPYGLVRLVVLGMMGAGGWLGSKMYR